MTERLKGKLSTVATGTGALIAKLEARADAHIARRAALEQHAERAFAPHEATLDLAEQGLDEVEGALRLLSNAGPTTGVGGS